MPLNIAEAPVRLNLRGISPWLVMGYLKELGGRERAPDLVAGDGWQATVTPGEPVHVGSIRLGVTEVEFSGEAAAVKAILADFKQKTLRAGG